MNIGKIIKGHFADIKQAKFVIICVRNKAHVRFFVDNREQ